MAKLKKAFGRLVSNWKAQAAAANPGASDEDLARVINDTARQQGFDYTITSGKVRAKAKAPAKKRRASTRPAPAAATATAPAAARRTGGQGSTSRAAEGQLLADLRAFVQLVGKEAARSLLNDMVDRL